MMPARRFGSEKTFASQGRHASASSGQNGGVVLAEEVREVGGHRG